MRQSGDVGVKAQSRHKALGRDGFKRHSIMEVVACARVVLFHPLRVTSKTEDRGAVGKATFEEAADDFPLMVAPRGACLRLVHGRIRKPSKSLI